MPWFAVEDTLALHPKTLAAGNQAIGVWVRAGSWCMQQLTDGVVPADMAKALGSTRDIDRLVAAGLWIPTATGFRFHQWEARQRSRKQVEADREAARLRQERFRKKGRGNDPDDAGATL